MRSGAQLRSIVFEQHFVSHKAAELAQEFSPTHKTVRVRTIQFLVLACAATALCSFALAKAQQAPGAPESTLIDVRAADLLVSPPSANWPSYNGDYTGRRYSSLRQINPGNVRQLRAEWVFHSRNSTSLEVTPIVINGVMFVTSANDAFAVDARTGRTIWHYSRPMSTGLIDDAASHHSRGVGVWHSRVYLETDNAHLLCLDARSGNLLWDIQYADSRKNYGATSAPLVVKNEVLVGTSGGDDGVRGFLAAFDARTGRRLWRLWTIPGPREFGSSSWPGKSYLLGGGTAWMPGTYDPKLNTIYWGTSNPSPDEDGSVRPGDDLYTDCVLAVDPDTGKLKWYFQFTPHDLYDYDSVETPIIIDSMYRGRQRKLLVQANRNGFLYVLDRTNGRFLSAVPFAQKLNWAKGIDAAGRPILTGIIPTASGARVCPGFAGATNWYSPSFDPQTHLLYFMALEDCETYYRKPQAFTAGSTYYATGARRIPGEAGEKFLLAYNLDTGRIEWRKRQLGQGHSWAGTLSTSGGLLFFGDDSGSFVAAAAKTGTPLWHFNTGQNLHASPMSYAVNGRQYVAIAAGSDIFSFVLPD
ncbi:MAG TPA: PQQ-binding-like beta-propeller repeat protein [Terriglobia bacterium]|nr:PQQ-binding-like beta-propeller repeat protein [Terriglobia bacterium]